jgi:hypothetical protein
VTELATEPLQVAGELDEKYADKILARVGELAVGREVAAIKAKLQRMNPEEDQAAYGRMFGDLIALEQRRQWLLGRAAGALSPGGRPPVPPGCATARHWPRCSSDPRRLLGRAAAPDKEGRYPTGETLPDVLAQIARRLNLRSE